MVVRTGVKTGMDLLHACVQTSLEQDQLDYTVLVCKRVQEKTAVVK